MSEQESTLLTTLEFAQAVERSRSAITKAIRQGRLKPAYQLLNGAYLFTGEQAKDFKNK